MGVPVDNAVNEILLGVAVQELLPKTRTAILHALAQAIAESADMPHRLLQALAAALQEADAARSAALLRIEGRRWAAEDRPIAALAEQAIAAARLLAAHLRPLLTGEEEQAEAVRLSFLSEVLAGYVQAREEIAAQRHSAALSARMNELDALYKVISAANSSLNLDAVLHLVVRTVAEVMHVEVCDLHLFEPERGTLVLGASVGLNPEAEGHLRIHLGEGVTGWAAQQGKPVVVPDVHQEPRFLYDPSLHEEPFHSLLSVPIILYTVEKLVGVLNVRTREIRHYTPEEVNFLEMVAGEVAISLENARLYEQTDQRLREKVDELTALQRVSAMLASSLDLERALGVIGEQAAKLGRADMAAIVEWGTLRHEPEVVASWGVEAAVLDQLQEWLERAQVYHQVSAAGQPVVLSATDDDVGGPARAAGFHTLLCLPLRGKDELLGTICLHTHRPDGFVPDQVDLLTVFADQAALAIENARLYDEVRRSLDTKSTLLQEMHHRVRNNLQAVASLLNMQVRRMQDPRVVRLLEESASRIQSIAAVHDLLCQETLGVTTVQAVTRQVLEVAKSYQDRPGLDLRYQVVEEPPLPVGSKEATLLALLVNELFSNAIAHGFAGRKRGTVIVDTYLADECIVVQVKDDGQGPVEDTGNSEGGLGLQIIRALVTRDLDGTFSLHRDGDWTVAVISFPYLPPQEVSP
jgi:two-component sensor histidine kinase/putative methionine-R-sulfoxide reductase with GAF domain